MDKEWYKIISFNGSQANAFEELVCQIAMAEKGVNFKSFERVGTPDGGVECYWQLNDDSEFGWQAKYYADLKSGEWANIKKSLFDAILTHPKLIRYYICLPHNLSDGRRGKNTQKSIWEGHKKRWEDELLKLGYKIDIVLWNSSLLFSKLIQSANAGIKSFFFSEIEINEEQLFLHLDAAIDNLGPKYSPDLNFKLNYLPSVFDALSRNNRFKESFTKRLDELLLSLSRVMSDCSYHEATKSTGLSLREKHSEIVAIYQNTDFSPSGQIPVSDFVNKINDTDAIISHLKSLYRDIEAKYQAELKEKANSGKKEEEDYNGYYNRKTNDQIDNIYKNQQIFTDFKSYLTGTTLRTANEGILFLSGKPGTGKSHLLADIATERKKNLIPSVFLLGEHFTNQSPKVFIQQLLSPNNKLEDYLKALETLAKTKRTRILFIIDAINEGAGKYIWKTTIAGLVKELSKFKWLGFVFSYRSTYREVVIPDGFNPPHVIHNGFEGIEYEATKSFFEYYKIQQPRIPILNPEFSNPLFLKTFCITLNKSGKTTIPEGYEGVSKILDEYVNAVNKNVGERLNYPYKKVNLVSKAIDELVNYQVLSDDFIIPWEKAFQLVEPLIRTYSSQSGLLEELINEGLFIEDFFYNRTTSKYEQHGIVFNYERFNEHLKALYLLRAYTDIKSLKKGFAVNGSLRKFFVDHYGFSGSNAGLLNAFSVIIPEKYNIEIYEVFKIKDDYASRRIYTSFLQSIIWRKHDSIKPQSWEYIKKHLNNEEEIVEFYNTILLLAANSKSYFNGDFIHRLLKSMNIAERDYAWSIKIDTLWNWHSNSAIKRIIDWSWSEEEKNHIKDESFILLGKILSWCFTNSNRNIRDRATKAFSNLFINKVHLLQNLISDFKEVDDPYVLERIMGGSFGAVVHSSNLSDNISFAQYIYDVFFSNRRPPLNVLTRDYCKGIIEHVVANGGDLKYKKENLYPPFDYPFPNNIPSEKWIKTVEVKRKEGPYTEEERGQAQIPHSVLHWDFARYILGTNHGSSIPFTRHTIKSREAYVKLNKQLRGYKKSFFTIYVQAITMLNGSCKLGKKIRRNFNEEELNAHIEFTKETMEHARNFLKEKLNATEWELFEESQAYIEDGFETRRYDRKRFDVNLVQRYILKRVFDLGWTKKLFGTYDANVDSQYRKAGKAERIGKKYQWIAYYEILALLSDNYDFLDRYSDVDIPFIGTWQISCRNIDPTALIKYNPDEENETGNWWIKESYTNWAEDRDTWLKRFDDMPNLNNIAMITDDNGNDWYLIHDRILWRSEKQIGTERYTAGRKELWIDINAFLVSKNSKKKLLNKASEKLYWLRSNSYEVPHYYRIYLGELFYSDAYNNETSGLFDKYPYSSFMIDDKKIEIIHIVEDYGFSSEYDLSGQKPGIYKPSKFILELLKGKPGRNDACIYNERGEIIAFDSGAYSNNSERAFLINKKTLDKALEKQDLELIWFFCGEKEDIGPNTAYVYRMLYSGFIFFQNDNLQIKYHYQQQI